MAKAMTIRYTTEAITVTLRGIDLTNYKVLFTISQGAASSATTVTITNPRKVIDDGDTILYVGMTQAQSGGLKAGKAKVQVNWIDSSGTRGATDIVDVTIGENLIPEVITYA